MIKYPVLEIFTSIQGEGTHIGTCATFIRLVGCNLRCSWCDTKLSWDEKIQIEMSIKEILLQVKSDFVVITGGEPCLYDLDPLIQELHSKQKYVCLETNGTLPTPREIDWVTCSPKPGVHWEIHEDCRYDELKYVVDEVFSVEAVHTSAWQRKDVEIWLQPEGYNLKQSAKKAFALVMEYPRLRMGIQLHKILEVK